jgi:hypothetical protein
MRDDFSQTKKQFRGESQEIMTLIIDIGESVI